MPPYCSYRGLPLRLSLLCVVALAFGSCEEVIESPFDIIESKLVLASTFTPHNPVAVRVTATQPVTGEVNFLEVRDATVSLFEGPEFIEVLKFEPGERGKPGVYRTQDFHPKVGHKYTIHALADGFTPVTADSRIPTHVSITALRIADLSVLPMIDRDVYDYRLIVDYADPADEANYYDLRISQEVIPFRVNSTGDTSFYHPILKSVVPGGANYNIEPVIGGQASVLLQDKDGESGVSIHLQSIVNPSEEILGNIHAELRTVSEPYFLFQRNLQGEGTVSGGVVEPRVNSYTNVASGYGVFAGYNVFTYISTGF